MATQNLKVRSGNRVVVKFDGKLVGLVRGLRASDDFGPEPASGIGDIHVQEYVPTMARHSLSAESIVLKRENLREAGIALENGDAALDGMVFDIEIFDKDTGALLRKYTGCSPASSESSVNAHQIVMLNVQLNALDVVGTGL